MALGGKNVILFSVVRTPEREPLFYWIGTVCQTKSYLWKLKNRTDIPATTILSDLLPYQVGVVRDWAGDEYLRKHGFTNIQAVSDSRMNILKLFAGRVDLIEDYEESLLYRMSEDNLDTTKVEKVIFNEPISGELYAVFSRQSDPLLVEQFRAALEAIKKDGRYEAIRRKWLKVKKQEGTPLPKISSYEQMNYDRQRPHERPAHP